ncbi:MAG: T9SS type A sorting domain-containing protein [Bacteroidales bacterium]|nr:T9SS type A sorting domain-containing protein [Bacteroidales bacterium]
MNSFEFFCNFALSSWLWIMKRIILFCGICCLSFFGYAKHDVAYICQGDTYSWNLSGYYSSDDTLVYVSGPTDWIEFSQSTQYDTVIGNILLLSPLVDKFYQIISVNGVGIDMNDCPMYLTIHVKIAPTISIDSIHHVTCPDGAFYPYMDGVFHVSLDDFVQNYAWINIQVDTPFFFVHTSYDSVTLTGLRAGTYYITAYGTNGCVYRDSVTIEQPEAWYVDYSIKSIDTVCFGQTGCIVSGDFGGTPPYNFTWFYYADTGQVFLPDTTRMVCDLYSGQLYYYYLYDSRGCKAWGDEIEYVFWYLYEWAEDSTHIITTDSIACYGRDFLVQAQSIGVGTYTWYVGDQPDSINYWTGVYGDSMFVADYITPPITEPTWVYAEFSDQHNCVTRDSIWVEVYNSNISLSIETPNIVTDSICTVQVFPPGGNLFVDGVIVGYNIPSDYTFSTAGIQVGPHTLRYAGTFGAEIGVGCDDETTQAIQVEINPFVQDWEYDVSIYPNPAITTLNLTSTATSDFDISILDVTGKVIKTEKMSDQTFTIDVSDLASGIYMLRLVSQDGASKIVKFVKR